MVHGMPDSQDHGAKLTRQQKKEQQQAESSTAGKKKKVTAAQLRVQNGISEFSTVLKVWLTQIITDLGELYLPSTMKTEFPNPDDILNFLLHIEPDEGMYKGGKFTFSFAINQNFPHDPPKVKCLEKIYHPNIDTKGNVCLNILRDEWKPVLNLNAVIVGLQVSRSL
jgi:ubiquitin-conjugating enzyme E2 M